MTRKPVFWIVLFILSIFGVLFTFRFFPDAFPLVNVDIAMNRQQALSRAKQLAEQHGWGPRAFRQAASFSLDSELQHFVELEAGGVEKFNQLLDGQLYSPYQWIVRHFQEGEKTETLIRFTPDGRFFGFAQQLPESQPGASLSADSALAIARAGAARWNLDLSPYALAEQSQEKRIGGRLDHTFVYERSDEKLGEGLYRLQLTVAGDELTAVRHFVKIPEAFQRRYQEMRSANETLAMVAMFAMILLYGVLGIGVGLFFQLRERWIKWRTPLICGCVVALLQVLDAINNWPLAWMDYDTALSGSSFFLRQLFQLVTIFFAEAVLLTLTFMAAEGLTRKAFPNQIQLWKIWRTDAARSVPVLGHTLGGLLGVSLFFAFDTALYLFAGRLGWWTPSSSLFEPDVLATYQPWLSSIAISLHAGFWEECLFRAVPIAGAALLGRRFGREKLWIIGAFIVQALIFGGGHANYATQPAYARLVELIVPSLAFGLIYLFFGLLPAVILHFAYDVVWFALPLFVSSTPNIWVQQVLVILFTLVPLWIVLRARLAKKAWLNEAPDELKNKSFVPIPPKIVDAVEPKEVAQTTAIRGIHVWLAAAGIVGVVLWFLFADVRNMAPKLTLGRRAAMDIAQAELAQRGIELPAEWKMLSRVEAPLNVNDRFIWQEEGDSVYASLMGSYIGAPYWLVRCATFSGDVAARAEEYQIKIEGDNKAHFQHILPEKAAGDSLTEAEARPIAQAALARFGLEAAGLKEVSVTPSKLENRTDWEFVWADTAGHPLTSGECRIRVQLAGGEVVDAYQYVHVPEEWSRAEREKNTVIRILDAAFGAIPLLLLVVAFVYAIIHWSRKQFDVVIFLRIAILLGLINLFGLLNSWPEVTSVFLTAMPWQHQALIAIIFSALGALAIGGAIGMINGLLKAAQRRVEGKPAVRAIAALGAGIVIVALTTLVGSFAPSLKPPWAEYDGLSALWPLPRLALGFIARFFTMGSLFLLIATVADRFSASWTRHRVVTAVIFILLGIALTDVSAAGAIPFWLLAGSMKGVLLWLTYLLVLRHRPALAPWVYLPFLLFQGVRGMLQAPFPGAVAGLALGLLLVVVVAVVWERWLRVD